VLRAEHSFTQARLADELDVSRQTVNAIETGKYDPSLPLAFRIARVFDQPIEAIFFPDDATPTTSVPPAAGTTSAVSADWP
jgi:putative transcriptional regulator